MVEVIEGSVWSRFKSWWLCLPPLSFLVVTNLLMFGFSIVISPILLLLGMDENTDIGGPDFGDLPWYAVVFIAVVFAPLIETVIFQWPILYLKRFAPVGLLIFISSIAFAASHAGYSFWYALIIFPMGVILAYTMTDYNHQKMNGFWATVGVHALRNGIAMAFMYGIGTN